jgi:chromosome segregation protein
MPEQELEQEQDGEEVTMGEASTKINKVSCKGFKSFQRKTSIPFYEGLTAIVGENGNGKSNILDALSFVFGRRSSRLRAEKLEQLIFNGGESRKQADYAHCTVYLDNTDGLFDEFLDEKDEEETEEITIGRKVTRAGSSMYKFMGTNCKRSFIERVAEKANIDPEGYHFVRQGKVTEIVEQSDRERREVIDELSGVKEFDEKKDEAEEELEEVQEKLNEQQIILDEKKEYLEKLKEEKEIALKYRELEERKKKIEGSILEVRKRALSNRLADINTDTAEKQERVEELEEKLEDLDEKIDDKQDRIEEIEEEQSQGDTDVQHLDNRIEKKRGKIENKRDKIEDLEDTIEELEKMKNRGNTGSRAVDAVLSLDNDKIEGAFQDLISTEDRFAVAVDTAAGGHMNDVVVENKQTAVDAINYLKRENIGRARMLPLDKIKDRDKSAKSQMALKKKGVIDYASNLIEYDEKYQRAINNVFSDTLIAEDLDSVKDVDGVRVVTLDGDVMSRGGSMSGGKKKSKGGNNNLSNNLNPDKKKEEKEELEEEIEELQRDIAELKEMKERKEEEQQTDDELREEKNEIREEMDEMREERQELYSEKEKLKSKIDEVGSKKANLKAELENVKEDLKEYDYDEEELIGLDSTPEDLKTKKRKVVKKQNSMGPVNMRAIEEYKEKKEGFDEFKEKVSEIRQEKLEIEDMIEEIEEDKRERFMQTLNSVNKDFSRIFEELFDGGEGELVLEDDDIEKGLKIRAAPPGKDPHIIQALSGGEKTMTAIAFVFAILEQREAPFYIMDEIDAALDKQNSKRLSEILKDYSEGNQFIVISHNDITVRHAERAYGVSMKDGVTKMRSIELDV